jgi:oxidase EvaA
MKQEVLDTPSEILDWRIRQQTASGFRYHRIPLSEMRRWRLVEGRIEHETGKFFGVIGVTARSSNPHLDGWSQPIIDQPEVGTLGFLLRRSGDRTEILVQAKTEPGNVGAVQLAPSIQATLSNQNRLHGGAPTPYLQYVSGERADALVADELQSEQGTRFLSKYNRNVTCLVDGDGPDTAGDAWRWCSAQALLALLHRDYLINTDARSVLVCSPWELLGPNGTPFSVWRETGQFGEALLHSCESSAATLPFEDVLGRLEAARRAAILEIRTIPVQTIPGWSFSDDEIADLANKHFCVSYHRIHTLDREVVDWDQPLLSDYHSVDVVLVCQLRDGLLHFLLRHGVEIGFREKVQFGPTLQIASSNTFDAEPLQSLVARLIEGATTHADSWASDEGGRFDHNRVRYRIVEIPADVSCEEGTAGTWATLGQIRLLLAISGALTNEARSALSLLLPFLWIKNS